MASWIVGLKLQLEPTVNGPTLHVGVILAAPQRFLDELPAVAPEVGQAQRFLDKVPDEAPEVGQAQRFLDKVPDEDS